MKNLVQFIFRTFSSKVHSRDSGFCIKGMISIQYSSMNIFRWHKMGTLARNKLIIELFFIDIIHLVHAECFFREINTRTCAYQELEMLVFRKNLRTY